MILPCEFCEEYGTKSRERNPRLILEKDGHLLIPTVGCFTEGYCLYLPVKHCSSYAELGALELHKLDEHLNHICRIIETEYHSDLIVAEHGAGSGSVCGASCISHAHLHLIPVRTSVDVFTLFHQTGGIPKILDTFSELALYAGSPYLYLRFSSNKHLVWTNVEKFPRQFVRIVCAHLKGVPDMYNWRLFPFEEEMKATTTRLRARFAAQALPAGLEGDSLYIAQMARSFRK